MGTSYSEQEASISGNRAALVKWREVVGDVGVRGMVEIDLRHAKWGAEFYRRCGRDCLGAWAHCALALVAINAGLAAMNFIEAMVGHIPVVSAVVGLVCAISAVMMYRLWRSQKREGAESLKIADLYSVWQSDLEAMLEPPLGPPQ